MGNLFLCCQLSILAHTCHQYLCEIAVILVLGISGRDISKDLILNMEPKCFVEAGSDKPIGGIGNRQARLVVGVVGTRAGSTNPVNEMD